MEARVVPLCVATPPRIPLDRFYEFSNPTNGFQWIAQVMVRWAHAGPGPRPLDTSLTLCCATPNPLTHFPFFFQLLGDGTCAPYLQRTSSSTLLYSNVQVRCRQLCAPSLTHDATHALTCCPRPSRSLLPAPSFPLPPYTSPLSLPYPPTPALLVSPPPRQVLTKVDPTQFIPPSYCKSAAMHRSCGPDAAQMLAAL